MSELDLSGLVRASQVVDVLREEGWSLSEIDFVIEARFTTTSPSSALQLFSDIEGTLVSAVAQASVRSQPLRLVRTGAGGFEVAAVPTEPASDVFPAQQATLAEAAWNGNAEAAELLGLDWELIFKLDLSRLVDASEGTKVALKDTTIASEFTEASLADLRRLVPRSGRRVYVALDGSEGQFDAGALSIICLSSTAPTATVPPRMADMPGEAMSSLGDAIPSPTSLLEMEPGLGWIDVREALSRAAAQATWMHLANDVDGTHVEYFGFKRAHFELPPLSWWTPTRVDETLRLQRWAFGDPSPDRLLAIRQVVSLYDQPGPFESSDEVRASAEPIYMGLRSDAVAEVVRSSRDAQAHALEAVRQTLAATQDLSKAVTERAMAGAVAVAAVLISNVAANVPAQTTNWLLTAVAAFFLFLLAAFLLIDSPALSLPLKHLDDDLHRGLGLLTGQRRDEFVNGASVLAARSRVRVVRIGVSSIYAVLALATATLVYLRVNVW